MKKYFAIIFFILFTNNTLASIKSNIIENLLNIENLSFKFEQNTNGKIENGECIIEYPKKIYCEYKIKKKLLVSNGNSLVIKTASSFYIYPIEKTPLNLLLDKDFLLKKLKKSEGKKMNNKFINYNFIEDDNKISLFFDKKSYNLIGWQTTDIYQNINTTFLSSINKNISIKKNLFKLPTQK
jgi:outer membrane lipoprotein-sorting protein